MMEYPRGRLHQDANFLSRNPYAESNAHRDDCKIPVCKRFPDISKEEILITE